MADDDSNEVPVEEFIFHNTLILESVFKFCTIKELCQCRLVCKLWHYVCLPFWSDCAGPIILYEHFRDAVLERNKHLTIASFLDITNGKENDQTINGLPGWSFRRFRLMFFRDLKCGSENERMFQFWSRCGSWITDLQLVGCRLADYSAYKDVLFCKYTPHLKNLQFSCQYDGVYPSENIRFFDSNEGHKRHFDMRTLSFQYCIPKVEWTELLSHYPNLTSIELSSPYRLNNWEREVEKMFDSIRTLRKSNDTVLRLDAISINVAGVDQNPIRNHSLRISDLLMNTNLKLKSLSVDAYLFRGARNSGQLENVFREYRNTLQKLKIRDFLGESPLTFPTLTMPSLKELILLGKSFKNMDFLKFTPNLLSFHVINPWKSRVMDRYILRDFIKSSDPIKLEYLRNFRYDYDCTPCGMLNLTSWMPNIEVLNMPLTNETFRIVCQFWGNLKHLIVQKNALDDDGICGVIWEGDVLTKVAEKIKEHGLFKPPASIRNLKDLRSFVMKNNRYNNHNNNDLEEATSSLDTLPTRLTEASFVHGFLELPYLQKLQVTVVEYIVSAELLETLKSKIGQVNVVQTNHPYRLRHLQH